MTVHIFGGGTVSAIRSHMGLCALAKGRTARRMAPIFESLGHDVQLHLTGLADWQSDMDENSDVEQRLREVLAMPGTKAVIFNAALVDFSGQIGDIPSGKYAERLQTREVTEEGLTVTLRPMPKLLGLIRDLRPDVISVGFKTTANKPAQVQLARANRMAAESGITWVLANDVGTRNNIVLPGGGSAMPADAIFNGTSREAAEWALAQAVSAAIRADALKG